MIKKPQKWIALLVAISFAWLLQVSAMPLAAVKTTEQATTASAEQAPGFIEQIGDDWVRPKTYPVIFILSVVIIAILIVLISGGFGRDAMPGMATKISRTNNGRIETRLWLVPWT